MAAPTPVDLSAALVLTAPLPGDWLLILPPVTMILFGAVLMMLRNRIQWHGGIGVAGLALLVLETGLLLARVAAGGPLTMTMGRWLPPFGIAFTADVLGALMAFVASVAALAAGIFALVDIDSGARRYGFFPFLMLLMAGVTGAFLTGDIFNLYVWFEVLLISSFGLLVLGSEREQIDGGLKYAILNLVGTTLFLITVGYLYGVFGTLNMADIALKVRTIENAPLMTLSALFLMAFAMKAAAFPVNFWLPASYHTPRITVSAIFGGLLTKVGVYALLRVVVMLFPLQREELSTVIAVVAILTMVIAALGMLAQDDLRRMAGFAVILGIGNVLAGIATGTTAGISGAVLYALHSMLTMTALYLIIGRAALLSGGEWRLSGLGGLYAAAPGFAFLSLILFLAVSGLPPASGLWPKVSLVKAALDVGAWWLAGAILVSGFLSTIALARVFLLAYWRPAPERVPGKSTLGRRDQWRVNLPVAVLVLVSLGFGLLPEQPMSLTQSAASSLLEPSAYIRSVFPQKVTP
ncbi:Na+/H+ antiporter subunit D [Rhizobium oryzicola]|uniref:Na+/H+ antiporter subunit D n=1 Tax=Rhizobium oryzicola TaxID=1232668 RepID=A0ABT8SSU6_9HYPH|nr:Na+/H+ antiporter subunit D [Rhizobium oryzicola]MDO1581492.1 Na+/H+ antiporter subunit D [Rhizobium oryzicola]